jgi:predicted nucleotidyltransferase
MDRDIKGTYPSLEKVVQALIENLPEIRKRYSITLLGVFGSYVHGEQNKSSDLDILVEFENPLSLLELSALQRDLSSIVGVKVDLVLKRTLKPNIGKRILSEVIYL